MAKRFLPLILIVAALAVAYYLGYFEYFSLTQLEKNHLWLKNSVSTNFLLTALVFIAVYTAVAALSIPGAGILSITSGFLFGPWFGTLFSVSGATLGACLLFFAVKTAFGASLREKAGPMVHRFADGFEKNAFFYLLTLRLIPIPFWLVNLVPSLLGVKFRTFALATFIGIIPGGFVFNLIGNGIGAALEQGQDPDLSFLTSPQFIAPLVGLGLLSLVPVLYKRFKKDPETGL